MMFLALAVLGAAIYSNTFGSAFVFDDFNGIVNNPAVRSFDFLALWHAFNTRFIVGLSLALNYALGQDNVMGYHLFNTLIHILNSFLVYQFACRTFETPRIKMSSSSTSPKLIGFLTALIFLTHPLQTQGVTYIWQRATSLASFFYLGALVFYIRGRLKASLVSCVGCLLFAVLGMFTKEIVFTLPFAILLYEFIFLREIPLKNRPKALLWVPLALSLLLIPWTMTQTNEKTLDIIRPHAARVSLENKDTVQGLLEMTRTIGAEKVSRHDFILTEMNVLRTYLRLFILPVNQNVDYDYPKARSLMEPNTLLSFFLLLSLLAAGFALLKKHPLLSFGIFWFFLTLSVESLVAQEEFIFEHRMYLPMVGLSLFLVAGLSYFLKTPKRLTWVIVGIAVCFSFLTYQRNFVWKDTFALWSDAAKKSPNKARPYVNLASAYGLNNDLDEALKNYDKAIALKPDYIDAYANRAAIYTLRGQTDKAMAEIDTVLMLDPKYAGAYNIRGSLHIQLHERDEAMKDLNRAIELNPNVTEFYMNRGIVYNQLGLADTALLDFNKSIELKPDFAVAYLNRGLAYEAKGLLKEALDDYARARALGYPDPRYIEKIQKALSKEK